MIAKNAFNPLFIGEVERVWLRETICMLSVMPFFVCLLVTLVLFVFVFVTSPLAHRNLCMSYGSYSLFVVALMR